MRWRRGWASSCFSDTHGGYTATEAGEDLLRVAQATDDQFSQLAGRIKGRGEGVSGDLVVTSLSSLGPKIVPVLAEFQRAHEGLVVHFVTGERLFRLEYAEAHVAIRAGPPPDQPDNVVRPFVHVETGGYASRAYVEEHGMPQGPEDYGKHRFIGSDRDDSRAPFLIWLRENVPASAVTFRTSDTLAAEAAMLAGAGISFCHRATGAAHPDLVEVLPPRKEWRVPLWLVTHVDLHRTTKVQTLLKFFREKVTEGYL